MANEQTADRIRFLRLLRQVRNFEPRPVPQEAIDDILEVGRWTGTASNSQKLEVVVVRDRQKLEALSGMGFTYTPPGAPAPVNTAGHIAGAQAAVVIITEGKAEQIEMEAFDEGRLVERIMLAANAHGIGSGIAWLSIEGGRAACRLLGVPEGRRIKTVLSMGYTDAEALRARPKRGRKPLEEFAHIETY